MGPEQRIGSRTRLTLSEQGGIDYLYDEIDWHRRAGRLLLAFIVVGASVTAGLLREFLADGITWAEWPPIITSGLIALAAAISFGSYYRRMRTLKSVAQKILYR